MADNFYKIGTSVGSLTNLYSLATPIEYPYHDWNQYPVTLVTGANTRIGVGTPSLDWTWKFLQRAQRDFLRTTYCASPALSSTVYISQLDTEGVDQIYTATLNWPAIEDIRAERVLNFVLNFTNVV